MRVLVLEVVVGASVGVSTASTVVVVAVVAAAIIAVASSVAFNLSHFFRGDAIFLLLCVNYPVNRAFVSESLLIASLRANLRLG